jgi:hypothetical protein
MTLSRLEREATLDGARLIAGVIIAGVIIAGVKEAMMVVANREVKLQAKSGRQSLIYRRLSSSA